MGLFSMFRDPEKLDRKQRPSMPMELLEHYNFECEKVAHTIYHQDELEPIRGPQVKVVIARNSDNYGHDVMLTDGTIVGKISKEKLARIAIDGDNTTMAEVSRPIYRTTDNIQLYIPLNRMALLSDAAERERKKRMENLTIWVNVDAKKWDGPTFDSGQIEYHDADFSLTERKGAKPLLSVVAGGATLTTLNARMKVYKDLMERSEHHIRKLIVKRKDGQYGPYYSVGFYF